MTPPLPKPPWLVDALVRPLPEAAAPVARRTGAVLRGLRLATVCREAGCPNRAACFSRGTATFLLLGPVCTRGCGFCGVSRGVPGPPDDDEPWRLLTAVRELGLNYVVLTSVTRDDLPDGGAGHFAAAVRVLRRGGRGLTLEVLTPDFGGRPNALADLAAAAPEVWGHNLETVPRLYPAVRRGADYSRSLDLLRRVKALSGKIVTKSGLMLGLGETDAEVRQGLGDLRQAGVDILTLGQYLAPSPRHTPVARYVDPAAFARWEAEARGLGFVAVAAGPLVRSSSQAPRLWRTVRPLPSISPPRNTPGPCP